MRTGSLIAHKSGPCAICTQEIKPQVDIIRKTTGGLWVPIKDSGRHYMAAGWAHEGCVPEASLAAPCLAYEQIDALLELIKTTELPRDEEPDRKIRRLTGALRTARYNKRRSEVTDIAIGLGPDLYEAYMMILTRAATKHSIGDWHQPRTRDGQIWSDSPYNPNRVVPEAHTLPTTPVQMETYFRPPVPSGPNPMIVVSEQNNLLQDGFMVRGRHIIPVKWCLFAGTTVWVRQCDERGAYTGEWQQISSYQWHTDRAEAEADVAEFLAKVAR